MCETTTASDKLILGDIFGQYQQKEFEIFRHLSNFIKLIILH